MLRFLLKLYFHKLTSHCRIFRMPFIRVLGPFIVNRCLHVLTMTFVCFYDVMIINLRYIYVYIALYMLFYTCIVCISQKCLCPHKYHVFYINLVSYVIITITVSVQLCQLFLFESLILSMPWCTSSSFHFPYDNQATIVFSILVYTPSNPPLVAAAMQYTLRIDIIFITEASKL